MVFLQQEGDVCILLFNRMQAQHACRLFLNELKLKHGLTRSDLNLFSSQLRDGLIEPGFKYSRTRFYSHIRKTLLTLGLIGIQQRPAESYSKEFEPEKQRRTRGIVDKYVPIRQPIAKRAPDGLNLVHLTWIICQKWNKEFFDN